MRYEELNSISRDLAAVELDSGDVERISKALVQLALHDPDRVWLEALLGSWLRSDADEWIRGVAATALGHVARLHGELSTATIALLNSLVEHPDFGGRVEDALDDVGVFCK